MYIDNKPGEAPHPEHPELRICPACGWYNSKYSNHRERCEPTLGRLADELVARVPQAQATKLGYGDGRLAIGENIDDHDFVVLLRVQENGFSWENISCFMHTLSIEDATDLVESLLAWRARCRARVTAVAAAPGGAP